MNYIPIRGSDTRLLSLETLGIIILLSLRGLRFLVTPFSPSATVSSVKPRLLRLRRIWIERIVVLHMEIRARSSVLAIFGACRALASVTISHWRLVDSPRIVRWRLLTL